MYHIHRSGELILLRCEFGWNWSVEFTPSQNPTKPIVTKRIKYLRIKLPKEAKDLYSENYTNERNQRWYKQMKRYTMFLDWKNQYCENDYNTQSNLQIQCNPFQTTNGIFHRTRTKNFTICLETQKTPNSQSNLEKEKRSWRNHSP